MTIHGEVTYLNECDWGYEANRPLRMSRPDFFVNIDRIEDI
jgi:hypothetical protein